MFWFGGGTLDVRRKRGGKVSLVGFAKEGVWIKTYDAAFTIGTR